MQMAKNGKVGDGHRNGAVRERSQTFNPKIERWVERDTNNGQIGRASCRERV